MESQQHYVSYENYDETSKNYDNSRRAVGLKEIDQLLEQVAQKQGVQVKDLTIVDAGCGTGNYTGHLYQKVKKYIGIEFNEGMVTQFKKKYSGVENITLHQKSIFDTGLDSEIGDVVIINQVVHHLDTQNSSKTNQELQQQTFEFPNNVKTFTELYRLLKKNGAIACNFTPIEQMFGVWYINHLYPHEKTEETWNKLCPNKDKMKRLLTEIGYKNIEFEKIDDPFMYNEIYLDVQGPFNKHYRDGDSFWGLITAQETEECLAKLKQILSGDAEGFKTKIKKELEDVGQSTTVVAYKL